MSSVLVVIVISSISNTKRLLNLSSTQHKKMSYNNIGYTDIVWMDLEMTGLDITKDKILEVSCIITDKDLNILSEGPCFAINHPDEVYQNMNEWCMKHHFESGLVDRSCAGT
ncbi:probable oligoribonuclease isoform X2 [Scaptodrosophila lebanonensis]|uniref:Probable oligoribonuclease isoform X2 n=1 Tax=Drosophila lebanonensis TaxID=7225 RepID=A0A6J2T3B5_DROLE|nr:probable oligoribonuclease isoform X2 [Scaptodrosophila lebanonensis]